MSATSTSNIIDCTLILVTETHMKGFNEMLTDGSTYFLLSFHNKYMYFSIICLFNNTITSYDYTLFHVRMNNCIISLKGCGLT
jgi:hypothetical protein